MKSALAASLVLALALVLSACSDDPEPSSEPSTTASATTTSAATEGVISPELPADPKFSNDSQGVIRDVEVASCDTAPGDVKASGTATNSGKSARDLVVTISWTVGSTGDVVAKGIATVEDLAPGDTADWDVQATVPGSTTAACVPTALAGQLKG